MLTCTFFGHRDTPREIRPILRSTLIDLIENKNVLNFYVGNHGNFDAMVSGTLRELKEIYPIRYAVVFAYLPNQKPTREKPLMTRFFPTVSKQFRRGFESTTVTVGCLNSLTMSSPMSAIPPVAPSSIKK